MSKPKKAALTFRKPTEEKPEKKKGALAFKVRMGVRVMVQDGQLEFVPTRHLAALRTLLEERAGDKATGAFAVWMASLADKPTHAKAAAGGAK